MFLFDFGSNLEMEECDVLKNNLLEYCSILRFEDENHRLDDEDLLGLAEKNWTEKLGSLINNLQNENLTTDFGERMKDLFARFNAKHHFKVHVTLLHCKILNDNIGFTELLS